MRDNLAYSDYGSQAAKQYNRVTNKRTSGGVMIKKGTNQTRQKNTGAAKRVKSQAKGNMISVVLLVVMAFAVLFRGLMITSGYEKLEEKNATLSETISENQKIQFKIDQALDLNNIETIATEQFGMDQPTKGQTVYINLEQSDEVTKVSDSGSVTKKIKDFFGGIVEYFS